MIPKASQLGLRQPRWVTDGLIGIVSSYLLAVTNWSVSALQRGMHPVRALAIAAAMLASAGALGETATPVAGLAMKLLPKPRELVTGDGVLLLAGRTLTVTLPPGAEHDACRTTVRSALRLVGARSTAGASVSGCSFRVGGGAPLPPLPMEGIAREGYSLAVGPMGVSAEAASPVGLLYAAETFLQLARVTAQEGCMPALAVRDSPEFRMRGIYIEGGQERFGRIVSPNYLKAEIRRLAQLKMNTLVVEAYNLFPYASFPACADAGTLSRQDCEAVFAEAQRWHVTLVPSLQTLAQAYELVWSNEAGAPYREVTAPGLMCPSNPDLYPFIKGLYRDLLNWFSDTPIIGIGCSEIDMQWQARYCPKCKARIEKGETVRDLLLGHAERCIRAVDELSREMGRPVRPLMWGDEFYMYGPGRDWVGIERIPRSVVMGFWKYWPDYAGIGGLMDRGYDVLGISAIYNHCFYLADLSPENPHKSWPSMEQTGLANIAGMANDADAARRAHPAREFLGVATASFSKHRLRAFDSLWVGFALNAQCLWSKPKQPLADYRHEFLRAFARHAYGARTDESAEALAAAYERLDGCKSRLELANQTLHDVVGVVDTQEAGYIGNTLRGAWQRCGELLDPSGEPGAALAAIHQSAQQIMGETAAITARLDAEKPHVAEVAWLADLRFAAEKIGNHAERQMLLIDTRVALARAASQPLAAARRQMAKYASRWETHHEAVASILRRVSPLSAQGDPSGYGSVLGDVAATEAHLNRLASRGPAGTATSDREILVDEQLTSPDVIVWEVLGHPQFERGHMETAAPGGWGKLCGLLSRRSFALDAKHPLVIQFELVPVKMGVDSQLVAAATQPNDISFRFALACSGGRFSVHTQSRVKLGGGWADPSPGWHQRSVSPEVAAGAGYHVRAEITRRSWRVIFKRPGESPWEMPFWDSGQVPMDDLADTRVLFADVEPEGGTGATRWGPIQISRGK